MSRKLRQPSALKRKPLFFDGREHDDRHQHEEDRQLARAEHGRRARGASGTAGSARRAAPRSADTSWCSDPWPVRALDVGVAHRAASRWWVAACMTASGVASARSSSAVIRPSHRTSDAVGHAEDLGQLGGDHQDREALPGELGEQPVHLGLGADVDAPGGLVDDQQLGVGGQPLGDDDLLLVAAAHRGRGHVERAGLHLQAPGPGAGGPVLHGGGQQPGLRDARGG